MKKHLSMFSKKFYFFGMMMMLLSFQQVLAQKTVTGTVLDADGMGLPGASVIIQGTTKGTETDFDGNFEIEASEGDVLEVIFTGMKNKTITVGSASSYEVSLQPDTAVLEEVVIIGYGSARKADVTQSISSVSTESFKEQPLNRVGEALQGRASGVNVQKSGTAGGGFRIRVRGVSSISGSNDPLVVIDGIVGPQLSTINPSDIESMEVLKDASATAIYGSRGANGVILITTKKGKGKPKVVVDYSYKYSQLLREQDEYNVREFATYMNNHPNVPDQTNFTAAEIAYAESQNTMQEELFRDGFTHNAQVSLSGSSEDNKIRYYISGNYIDQEAIMINNNYNRSVIRSNTDVDVTDKLSVSLNVLASQQEIFNNPDALVNSFNGTAIQRAIAWDPMTPLNKPDGSPNYYFNPSPYAPTQLDNMNPIHILNRGFQNVRQNNVNLASNLKYKFTDNFSYTATVGYNYNQNTTETFRHENTEDAAPNGFASAAVNLGDSYSVQISNIFNYNNSFGKDDKHRIDLTGVYEFTDAVGYGHAYSAPNIVVPNIYYLDNYSQPTERSFTNSAGRSALESYLGRAQYTFNNSLNISASFRADGSSNFDKDNRWGFFSAVGAGYNFQNASFVADSDVLSTLKLRAGWGQVGNQAIPTLGRFTLNSQTTAQYTFDGTLAGMNPAVYLTQIGNDELTWETTDSFNAGFDIGFWNNRLSLAVDVYQQNTKDLLLLYTLPNTQNLRFYENVGEVVNKGLDVTINGTVIQKDELNWNVGLTGSYLENEITKLADGVPLIEGQLQMAGSGGGPLNYYSEGGSIGDFYGSKYLGTWKSTDPEVVAGTEVAGTERYETDADGNIVLGTIGNGLPDFTWGLNNTVDFKNWTFNLMITGSHGNDVYNMVRANANQVIATYPDRWASEPAWTPTNETNVPRSGTSLTGRSSRYVEDGSFVRINNLSAAYTFDNIKGIESLRIYGSGENLFLFTDYNGYDPEVQSNRQVINQGENADATTGIDGGAYPNPRSFTLGFTLTF